MISLGRSSVEPDRPVRLHRDQVSNLKVGGHSFAMSVVSLPGAAQAVELPEPDWASVYSDELDQAFARQHWQGIISELRRLQALTTENASQIERLVHHRLVHAEAVRMVAEKGAVSKPSARNAKSIARVSPWWTVMREAAADCDRIEAELGLSPRRRGSVSTVAPVKAAKKARDEFLGGAG